MTAPFKTFTTIDLLYELLRRLVDPDDDRRVWGMSVAELRRRAEDYDHARAVHPCAQ